MEEHISIRIEQNSLEAHVKRICRSNLKKPAKICTECPFLGPIIDMMERKGWQYNREVMKKPLENYYAKL